MRLQSRYPEIRYHAKARSEFDRVLNVWLLCHQQRGFRTDEVAFAGWDLLNLQNKHDTQKTGITSMSLYQLISQASAFDCTVGRDRIYSLLGMLSPQILERTGVRECLRPNYEKNNQKEYKKTEQAVLIDAVNAIILSTGELEFLERAGLHRAGDQPSWMPDLKLIDALAKPELRSLSKPNQSWENELFAKVLKEESRSWDEVNYMESMKLRAQLSAQTTVPEWSPQLTSELLPEHAHPFPDFFRCDATWSAISRPSMENQDTITAQAILLDTVDFTSDSFCDEIFSDYTKLLSNMEDFTDKLELEQGASMMDIQAAMSFTLIGGAASHSHVASEADVAAYHEFMNWLLMGVYADRTREVEEILNKPAVAIKRYYLSMIATATNRRLLCTASGFVGLGPSLMEDGDVVAIVFGSRRPVVLRPVEEKKFRFVGLCYVHGVMYGELIKSLDDEFRTKKMAQTIEIV
ncbi:uncharacterized protein CLAFUR5_05442 [Fulvia fulva]|uniref:Uncharacterized protein n=1 Tax=Passalora fulva TaxID=5499 RepID=A0A9Q8LIG0_PASFU|nr:uncharacterized protein CLAFUR5_05442 [Fulvia fulva]KAK4625508.1 hypothetical protein CLAFUR0_05296 [Fulvia fulva]UJO18231.1 hypothetical protein CLAFUR5_05442 [Fulvia fulva]